MLSCTFVESAGHGERGIRTPDSFRNNRFRGDRFQPLSHLSMDFGYLKYALIIFCSSKGLSDELVGTLSIFFTTSKPDMTSPKMV